MLSIVVVMLLKTKMKTSHYTHFSQMSQPCDIMESNLNSSLETVTESPFEWEPLTSDTIL